MKWLTKCPALSPAPLSRHALAALIYRAVQQEHQDARKAYQTGFEAGGQHARDELSRVQKTLDTIRATVNQFEQAAGISLGVLNGWGKDHAERLGKAVKAQIADQPSMEKMAEDTYAKVIRMASSLMLAID